MRRYVVTIDFWVDDEYDPPMEWDWASLIDTDPDNIKSVRGYERGLALVKEADPELERLLAEEDEVSRLLGEQKQQREYEAILAARRSSRSKKRKA
jgi:hypothetical protein